MSLLLCLVKKCPKVCNINHFVVLLGAYGATLTTSGEAVKSKLSLGVFVRLPSSSSRLVVFCRSETVTAPSGIRKKRRQSADISVSSVASVARALHLFTRDERSVTVRRFTLRSFLWGPAAVEHHKTRKSLGASLWKQTGSDELLALLKPDRMLRTIAHFPQRRRIIPLVSTEFMFRAIFL